MEEIIWYIIAGLTLASALGVLIMKKPLYSAFCLVLHLFMIAALFALLDAHFLATAQIIVYAGAIMVLVVFVIMLLSLDGAEKKPSYFLGGLSLVAIFALFKMLLPALRDTFSVSGTNLQGDVKSIGLLLYTKYIYSFEVASILIMVAIVGAVILAKRTKKNVTT